MAFGIAEIIGLRVSLEIYILLYFLLLLIMLGSSNG